MYKMCRYEAAMDKIGEDIPWIQDEQNLPVCTYGGYPEVGLQPVDFIHFYHVNLECLAINL